MIRASSRTLAILTAAVITAGGCESAPKAAPPAAAPVKWAAPVTRAESTVQLESMADQLDSQVALLPGSSGTEHRQLAVAVLDSLVKILQLVNGPNESPAFTNRLGVVKMAHDIVADQTIPRSRLEAAENQGLLAAVDALDEVSTRYLFDDDKLPDLVKAARDKVATALNSQGPMHDLDASGGFNAVDALVREETDALVDRFGSFDSRTRLAQRLGTTLPVAPAPMPEATTSAANPPAMAAPMASSPPATAPVMPTMAPATTAPTPIAAPTTAPSTAPAVQ